MTDPTRRRSRIRFRSGSDECAAWPDLPEGDGPSAVEPGTTASMTAPDVVPAAGSAAA